MQTRPERHVNPVQQLAPDTPQPDGPGMGSPMPGERHTPPEQMSPLQQSFEAEHVELRPPQQTPLVQVRPVQQSAEVPQCVLLFAWTQQVPREQRRPSSHVLPAQQAMPAGPQAMSGGGVPVSLCRPVSMPPPVPESPAWVFPG